MVSIKALVFLTLAAVAKCQEPTYACWCGPNEGTTRTACNAMADSGRMSGGRCRIFGNLGRDFFINTACTYGSGQEWCDVA